VLRLLGAGSDVPSTPILVTLIMEAIRSSETWVLKEPLGVTPYRTAFFIVTVVKPSNFTLNRTGYSTLCSRRRRRRRRSIVL
jgi:hypothetical protein